MSLQLSDGSVFAARYQVVRRIALGGMGAVYEVEHIETLRRLALKVMLPHIVQSAEMRDRFRREARVAANIESEHIVNVFDAGIDDATGMPFMVMELLRGEELAQALRRVGRFAPADVVTFLHQASLALEKTHRASIVHRDLKPENLFVTLREDGQPRIKVLDFGIAKLVAEGSAQDPSTRSLGTPLYMAPEQFRGGAPISPATDIYALGMIAYTLLVGASYWADEAANSANVFAFAGAVMAGPHEPATYRARRRGVPLPAAFDPWFSRVTALTPEDRFPGALAAVSALAAVLGTAQPPGVSTTGSLGGVGPASGPPSRSAPPSPSTAPPAIATTLYIGDTGSGSGPQAFSASGQQGYAASGPQQGYAASGPQQGYSASGPQQGYSASGPQQGYSASGPQQGYAASGPQQGYSASGSQQGYSASGPQGLSASGPQGLSASGPQGLSASGLQRVMGSAPPGAPGGAPQAVGSTGSGYGTTAGAAPRPVGAGKVVAAVAVGLVLGVAGIVLVVVRSSAPARETPRAAAAATVTATAATETAAVAAPTAIATIATSGASDPPVLATASATVSATASPEPPAAQSATAPPAVATTAAQAAVTPAPARTADPARTAAPPGTTRKPPDTGKKSIFVRD